MARVFISHADEDRAVAAEVHRWLVAAGHEVFLDRDLRDGIGLGEAWEQRLHERLRWANAVVCVVTAAYLDSTWCAVEIGIARSRGSRLLPLRPEPDAVHPLLASLQHVDYPADPAAACVAVLQALHQVDAGWPDDRSPFPGLRPFDTDQHQVFFGRTEEVGRLGELLRSPVERVEGAVLLVVGPSGCGKSSLVRAGLLPVLAGEPGWRTLPPILPGTDPVAALARELAALARRSTLDWTVEHVRHRLDRHGLVGLADELLLADPAGPQQRLLIVVDQFEELLTQTGPAERARFAGLLRPALTGPVRVVATLRPEFLDQLLVDPDLAVLPTRTCTLRPLRREALRAVIERPARLAGIGVDEHLVDRLVDDTDTGEALPLLAFTLAQLAEGVHCGGRLSTTRYEQLGGVRGALARQADTALADAITVGGRSREQVLSGLLRLVTVDEQGRPTRWRANRHHLPEQVSTELNAFVTRRLLTTDTDNGTAVIGVAHEAFLSAWPPLAEAIAKNVAALRTRRAVEHAATEWDGDGRPRERLWSGGQLAAAVTDTGARIKAGSAPLGRRGWSPRLSGRLRVLVTDRVDLTPTARDFLHTSVRHDRFRRRRLTTVLSVLLIGALLAAGLAVDRERSAQERQRIATARQLVADAGSLVGSDPRTALRLGAAAETLHPGGETRSGLLDLLSSTRYAGAFTAQSDPVLEVVFGPDGRTLATASSNGTVTLWDLADRAAPRQLGRPLTAHSAAVSSVVFSPEGRTLVTASDDGVVILWDLTDRAAPRQLGRPLTAHTTVVNSVAFGPDGRVLATASNDGTILWDLTDRTRPRSLSRPLTDSVGPVVFAPDGRALAVLGTDGSVILWDLTDVAAPRQLGQPLAAQAGLVLSVAIAPDGRALATTNSTGQAILWDLTDPTAARPPGQTLTAHTDVVGSVAFSPDGRTLATASNDGTAILWDITDLAEPHRLRTPHTDVVGSVAFSPDGPILATASNDGTAILWDVTDPAGPDQLGQPLEVNEFEVRLVVFAPDGDTLITAALLNKMILWDITDPVMPRPLADPRPMGHDSWVTSMTVAPDGRTLATAGNDGRVILWDITDPVAPRHLGQPFTAHAGAAWAGVSTALSPDGHTLVTVGNLDRKVILWDVINPAVPRQLSQPYLNTSGLVALSSDGRTLATSSTDRSVILWDVVDPAAPRRLGRPLAAHTSPLSSVAFSHGGRTLATGGADGSVILWDVVDPAAPRRLGRPLAAHTDSVLWAAFAPDGNTLATAGKDNTVILWDLTDLNQIRDHPVQRACFLAGGGLDRDEWERYLPDLPYQDTCPAGGN